ncbi:MAG: DUF6159 family protein [Chloroflexota bacterium]
MIGSTFRRSWSLLLASWALLKEQPSLLIFPVLAAPAFVAFTALAAGGGFLIAATGPDGADPTTSRLVLGFALMALGFYVFSFATVFLNTALAGCVLLRLRGGDPTVADGFRIARSRLGAIAGYAAIASVVGAAISAIQEKAGGFGQIAGALGGLAWGLATALVMPVLAAENVGPVAAITRSSGLLKRTFGAQIAGSLSLGAIVAVPMLLVGLAGGGLIALGTNSGSGALTAAGIAVLVAGLGLLLLLSATVLSALQQIFLTAVYHYAEDGQSDRWFTEDMLRSAFPAR